MRVRIYKPSKTAMQSIHAKKPKWFLEPVADSGCTTNQITLTFPSRESAVMHAEKQGWEYSVLVDRARKVRPRNYGENFRYTAPQE